jgi:hypothetical protein
MANHLKRVTELHQSKKKKKKGAAWAPTQASKDDWTSRGGSTRREFFC